MNVFAERSRHERIDYNALDFEEDIDNDGKIRLTKKNFIS